MSFTLDTALIVTTILPAFLAGLLFGWLVFRRKAERVHLRGQLEERDGELGELRERNEALERELAATRDQVKPLADEVDRLRGEGETRPRGGPVARATPVRRKEGPYDPGRKLPTFMDAPDGPPDDLSLLKGVGPKMEAAFRDMGIYYYAQIADWSPDEVKMVDAKLGPFRGRIAKDHLIEQAKLLAAGRVTEYEARFGRLGA